MWKVIPILIWVKWKLPSFSCFWYFKYEQKVSAVLSVYFSARTTFSFTLKTTWWTEFLSRTFLKKKSSSWADDYQIYEVKICKNLHNYINFAMYTYRVDKKTQLDVTFCILYFSSNSSSTCFGQPCVHHQELTTAWCYSLVLVCAVAAGRLSRPVGR